jgi:site-specific DNA-adenine methylase
MKQYGAPYMGSKSKIAEDILAILPRGKRFVDLFGGGFAMTHCAMLSEKYEEFYYNELNPLVVDMIKKAIAGEYKNERRWIDRETFFKLKDTDGYIKYCWSFGNKGEAYLYAKEIEPWKKALHYARVLGDCSLLKEFGIDSNGSKQDIIAHKDEYKEKYIKWYLKNICLSDADFNRLKNDLDKKIKDQKEELRQYLCNALKESGLTAAEVDRRLNTQMSGHYFGRSQWAFPTREEYNKMRAFMPLKPYDEVYGYQELLQSLESLQRLQSLERLQSLQRLELHCGSYVDYQHKEGDVVYCDPPYENTATYSEDGFNHKEFYDWVASRPYQVYFSSYEISDNRFYKVWSKQKIQNLKGQGAGAKVQETIYCNQPDKVMFF